MVSQRVIEVRCERCNSSFAPGTRRCVHCGGRLTRGRVLGAPPTEAQAPLLRAIPSASEVPGALAAPPPAGRAAEDASRAGDDELVLPRRVHNIIWIVTAIFVILGSILGRC